MHVIPLLAAVGCSGADVTYLPWDAGAEDAGMPGENSDGGEECRVPSPDETYLVYSAGLSNGREVGETTPLVVRSTTIRVSESIIQGAGSSAVDVSPYGSSAFEAEGDMIARSETEAEVDAEGFFLPFAVELLNDDSFPNGPGACAGGSWDRFLRDHPGADGIWSLSAVGFSCDGDFAVFYLEKYCGDVYTDAYYVFARRAAGNWILRDQWHVGAT